MLLHSIFLKTTADHSRLVKVGAAVLGSAALILAAAYPLLSRLKPLPGWLAPAAAAFDSLPGGPFDLPGRWLLEAAWFLLLPILLSIFAIELGSRLLAGQEESGELELLLAYPVSRQRLVLEKFAALAVVTAGLGLLTWLTAGLGFWAAGAPAPTYGLWLGMVLLALVFGSLAFAISGRSGRRAPARWISLVVLCLAAGLDLSGRLLPGPLAYVQYLSPLYDYAAGHFLTGAVRPGFTLLLAALPAILLLLAALGFRQREIS